MSSHFRVFTPAEWVGRFGADPVESFTDATEVGRRGGGAIIAHCAGTQAAWEAVHGSTHGVMAGDTIADLTPADQMAVLAREIEGDVPGIGRVRRYIKMNEPIPPGADTTATDIVPHLWLGEMAETVRGST